MINVLKNKYMIIGSECFYKRFLTFIGGKLFTENSSA
jgi:hypothetical protein